jgi:hypothetical protein
MKGLLESRQKALSAALDRAASSDRVLAAAQDALRSRREERDGNEGGTLGGSHRPRDAWLGVGRSLAVGDRCVLAVDHASAGEPVERVGVVAFIGPTALGEGDWVGVALDTPTGKHDGRVRGVRYFECALRHGLLVRQAKLRRYEELAGAKATTLQPRSPNEKIVNQRHHRLRRVSWTAFARLCSAAAPLSLRAARCWRRGSPLSRGGGWWSESCERVSAAGPASLYRSD